MNCLPRSLKRFNLNLNQVWIDPGYANHAAIGGILTSIGLFWVCWLSTKVPEGIASYLFITLFFAIALLIAAIILLWHPEKVTIICLVMIFFTMVFVFSTLAKSLFDSPNNHLYTANFLNTSTSYVLVLQMITYAALQKGAKFLGRLQYALLLLLLLIYFLNEKSLSSPDVLTSLTALVIAPLISLISLHSLIGWRDIATSRELLIQQEKEKLMAMMSHEIRGQLQTTLSASELLSNKMSDPVAKRTLLRLTNVTLHLDRYLRDWVEFVRVENPELSIECKSFNLITLVNQAIDGLQIDALARGLVINGPLWSAAPSDIRSSWQNAQGDSVRVQQVLHNLIDNALKYTQQGSIHLNVAPHHDHPNWVSLSVTDSGPGISEEDRALVFQPFLRLNKEDNSGIKGSGLGLAIAWRLMQRMGGKLEVISQLGQGSTFTMSFPLLAKHVKKH